MKTLKDHIIYYDEVCPMCNAYTSAFIKTGMLDADGREPYQKIPPEFSDKIDMKRAVNEIALRNKINGKVYYGVDSLFLIIQNSFPFFTALFQWNFFRWITKTLYQFISYNRRVIIPGEQENIPEHEPAFNKSYRLIYLVFTWLITSLILNKYSHFLTGLIPASNFYREFMICGGQIIFQGTVIWFLSKKRIWDYLGNMMTISFAGSLLLLFILIISKLFLFSPPVFAGCFLFVAGLMFLEHMRRMKILRLPWILSATWVFYRICLLTLILY